MSTTYDPNGPLHPEMRANLIADEIGMGPVDQRRKRVYEVALLHIRAAESQVRRLYETED